MRFSFVLMSFVVVACGDQLTTDPDGRGATDPANLRVVNTLANGSDIDVLVGGKVVIGNLASGAVSPVTAVPTGAQAVAFRRAGGTAGPATSLTLVAGETTTVLTVDSSNIINPWVLSDSGAAVPAGRTKLRAVHFAEQAPNLLAWRTQPDYGAFITIQFPFLYRSATPYLESDPGAWQVLVATEAYDAGMPAMGDTLTLSDAIAIPSGESRTVIIFDNGSGGVKLVVLDQ